MYIQNIHFIYAYIYYCYLVEAYIRKISQNFKESSLDLRGTCTHSISKPCEYMYTYTCMEV